MLELQREMYDTSKHPCVWNVLLLLRMRPIQDKQRANMKILNLDKPEIERAKLIFRYVSTLDGFTDKQATISSFLNTEDFQKEEFSKEQYRSLIIILDTFLNSYNFELEKIIKKLIVRWSSLYGEEIFSESYSKEHQPILHSEHKDKE